MLLLELLFIPSATLSYQTESLSTTRSIQVIAFAFPSQNENWFKCSEYVPCKPSIPQHIADTLVDDNTEYDDNDRKTILIKVNNPDEKRIP